MNPIVPVLMALGAILFFLGLSQLIRLSFKKSRTVELFRKEYGIWRFVFTTITSGIAIIMASVYLQKLFPSEPKPIEESQIAISSNLKYELESILPGGESNTKMMNAIARFQKEYQDALNNGDKNTMELLILEMAYLIRTELEKQDYPSHQIGSEVERIMHFLKRKPD